VYVTLCAYYLAHLTKTCTWSMCGTISVLLTSPTKKTPLCALVPLLALTVVVQCLCVWLTVWLTSFQWGHVRATRSNCLDLGVRRFRRPFRPATVSQWTCVLVARLFFCGFLWPNFGLNHTHTPRHSKYISAQRRPPHWFKGKIC